ncbi:MAG: putative toxin-antitoxin system toxin component, PIN family [Bryobacteraceae bacterium]|jgi:putative PIN family toxin of toxin-antitoxin system
MIRIVLDTNIVVSSLLQPLGPPARIFAFALGGLIQPCISGDIYAEYEEVIARPRFGLDPDTMAATLRAVREKSLWVRPALAIRACSDPDDDIFLECASAAGANYLVTGNLRHFPTAWNETVVVAPRGLLSIIVNMTSEAQPPA